MLPAEGADPTAAEQAPPTPKAGASSRSPRLAIRAAAGSPWVGWSGGVVSKSQTIKVTMNANTSVAANFK